jgi:hypothetical protein
LPTLLVPEWWQNGAPEEIRTPDPQIRSLGQTIEIADVRYRKVDTKTQTWAPDKA